MGRAAQLLGLRICGVAGERSRGRLAVELAPHPVHEAPGAFDAAGGPLHVPLGGRVAHHEQARRVDAEALGDQLGRIGVPLGLRHLLDVADGQGLASADHPGPPRGAFALELHLLGLDPLAGLPLVGLVGDHALGEQAGERLFHRQQAVVLQRAGDEA